ncbi:aspartate/glutamate racemase family protein [Chloroflexota bacterium]
MTNGEPEGVRNLAGKIRICATIPHAEGLENWGAVHEEKLAEIAHEGVEVVIIDLPGTPVTSVSTRHEADLVAAAHTLAAVRAEEQGFDAVAMGCLMEPGVAAARDMLTIPVIGEAQAAMHMAALVAPKFSFVGPDADGSTKFEQARYYGFTNHLVSVRDVGASSPSFAADEEGLTERMVQQAELAIEKDGARAIIGHGSLSVIHAMRAALCVPVINPVTSGILLAEMVVRARLL